MRARFVLVALVACARPPAISAPAQSAQSSEVQLAPSGEPGRKLTVTGVLVGATDRTPLARHRFRVYQADSAGNYRATKPDDERTARLAADVTTDSAGRFEIRTILPGIYGTPPGDPHLHFEVHGAEPAAHVVYFAGFVQESTLRWQKTTEQAHLITVARGSDGSIAGHLVLPVRRARSR